MTIQLTMYIGENINGNKTCNNDNRTFLNFSGVGRGCGRSTGRRLLGPAFSFFSHQIYSCYRFSLKTEHFLILVGWAWVWSFHGSAVVGAYIFGFVVPNLVPDDVI